MEIIALKVKNLIQTRNRVLVVLWPVTFLIDRQYIVVVLFRRSLLENHTRWTGKNPSN